jgi:hypothetical protein
MTYVPNYEPAVHRIAAGRSARVRRALLVQEAMEAAGAPPRGTRRLDAEAAAFACVTPAEKFPLDHYGGIANRLGAATSAARKALR